LDFLRARREKRYALVISDPQPLKSAEHVWRAASQMATVGIFLLLAVTALYFSRPILFPILAAVVVGLTLAPLTRRANAVGLVPWMTALLLVVLIVAAGSLLITSLSAPLSEWIAKAPEIGTNMRQKLYVLDRPLAALRELQAAIRPSASGAVKVESTDMNLITPMLELVTPALGQIVVFFGTLIFFLIGQFEFRRQLAGFFSRREAKLRFLRIWNDIEENLASYLAVMTAINFCLGVLVAVGAWLFGLPSPIIFGIVAMAFNYVPYVGPAVTTVVLLGAGLVTFPTLGQALLAPAAFVALATVEGHIITPTIIGHRLTLNPLAIFLAIAFWTWLWGPVGAFLAVPLSIIALVIVTHLFPPDEAKLPG
jgi:predicted PurR-regulated permease PerM